MKRSDYAESVQFSDNIPKCAIFVGLEISRNDRVHD